MKIGRDFGGICSYSHAVSLLNQAFINDEDGMEAIAEQALIARARDASAHERWQREQYAKQQTEERARKEAEEERQRKEEMHQAMMAWLTKGWTKNEPKSARAPDPLAEPQDKPPGWDYTANGHWYEAAEPRPEPRVIPRSKPPGWNQDAAGNWYRTSREEDEDDPAEPWDDEVPWRPAIDEDGRVDPRGSNWRQRQEDLRAKVEAVKEIERAEREAKRYQAKQDVMRELVRKPEPPEQPATSWLGWLFGAPPKATWR